MACQSIVYTIMEMRLPEYWSLVSLTRVNGVLQQVSVKLACARTSPIAFASRRKGKRRRLDASYSEACSPKPSFLLVTKRNLKRNKTVELWESECEAFEHDEGDLAQGAFPQDSSSPLLPSLSRSLTKK